MQNIDELEDLLIEAMELRKVKVEIITARKRDQPCYKGFLNSYLFDRLHRHGAQIHEEPFKYLHMKAVEIDDGKMMTLGSFNQDHWSFYCNNEANIFLQKNHETVREFNRYKAHQQFLKVFNSLQRESRPVDFEERYTPLGYAENAFWRLFLNVSHFVANNRHGRF